MYNLIRIEFKKAFTNKLFTIALIIGTVIAVLCAIYNIQAMELEKQYYQRALEISGKGQNPNLQAFGLYNHWICQDFSSMLSALYFMLFPILSAVAYGWSFFAERKSGYIKNVITRGKKLEYYLAKYIATFAAGGTVVTIPVVINFIVVACFLPALKPYIFFDIYYGVNSPSMFSELFYEQPLLYSFIRMLLVFLYGGGAAAISFALAFAVPNRIGVLLLPFLMCLGLQYARANIVPQSFMPELSPIYIIGSHGVHIRVLWTVLLEAAIAIAVTLALCLYKGAKEDVM